VLTPERGKGLVSAELWQFVTYQRQIWFLDAAQGQGLPPILNFDYLMSVMSEQEMQLFSCGDVWVSDQKSQGLRR